MLRYVNYFKYILLHKWYVFRACAITGCPLIYGIMHDISKFYPSEFFPYARRFYYPNGMKRKCSDGNDSDFDMAWLLHQKRNKHHWNYYVLVKDGGGLYALPMPEGRIREIVADWIGAGLAIHGKLDVKPWYYANKKSMTMHESTRKIVEQQLI